MARACFQLPVRYFLLVVALASQQTAAVTRKYNFMATIFPAKLRKDDAAMQTARPYTLVAGVNGQVLGPAVHVCKGDRLQVNVSNELGGDGLSIHWHGFEMRRAQAYDGVVGVTQCLIPPRESFLYDFDVDEAPGTYWWHTNSGAMSAQDSVKGPLIVHDCTDPARGMLVDDIASGAQDGLVYADERIIFLTDFFDQSLQGAYLEMLGGLRQHASKSEFALAVGYLEWVGGLINGSPQATIPVQLGRSTLLRVISSTSIFSLKFGVDQLRLSVVGTDGNPCEPFEVDEVIVGSAERFDVRITVPSARYAVGDTLWIRAETLENRKQGYDDHVILGTLLVTDPDAPPTPTPTVTAAVPTSQPVATPVVLNCFLYNGTSSETCLKITELRSAERARPSAEQALLLSSSRVDHHLLDFSLMPPPFFSTFVAHNGGLFKQHVTPTLPMVDATFDPAKDLHSHSVVVDLQADATIIMVFRTSSRSTHPIHLHGHKFEVLEVVAPDLHKDCTRTACARSEYFSSEEKRSQLAALPRSAVLKDTFTLPAGGAAAIRFQADNPGVWLGHCTINPRLEDGMAFIMREGGFSGLEVLPEQWPSCESPFTQARELYPACECHDNQDAGMGARLTEEFRCSRRHTCRHVLSSTATLDRFVYDGGIKAHRSLGIPGWGVALVGVCVALAAFKAAAWVLPRVLPLEDKPQTEPEQADPLKPTVGGGESPLPLLRGDYVEGKDWTSLKEDHSDPESPSAVRSRCTTGERLEDEGSANSTSGAVSSAERKGEPAGGLTTDIVEREGTHHGEEDVVVPMPSEPPAESARAGAGANLPEGEEEEEEEEPRMSFRAQVWTVVRSQWKTNYPSTINVYRLVEVLGLGLVSGLVFWEIGASTTNRGLRESISFLFFTVTLWTFNRMYPAVVMYTSFREQLVVQMAAAEVAGQPMQPSILAQVLGRGIVCVLLEGMFPILFGIVAFPLGHVIGEPQVWVQHILLLCLNQFAYAFIGGAVGTFVPKVPVGMIVATIVSQTTLVCAGFYVSLPPYMEWIRYISPLYYTFSGMVKGAYRTEDSFECNSGDSFLGPNWCFLEFSGSIDDLKRRGINVATYGDETSNRVWPNILILILMSAVLQLLIYVCLKTWAAALVNKHLGAAATWMGAPVVEMEVEDNADFTEHPGSTEGDLSEVEEQIAKARRFLRKANQSNSFSASHGSFNRSSKRRSTSIHRTSESSFGRTASNESAADRARRLEERALHFDQIAQNPMLAFRVTKGHRNHPEPSDGDPELCRARRVSYAEPVNHGNVHHYRRKSVSHHSRRGSGVVPEAAGPTSNLTTNTHARVRRKSSVFNGSFAVRLVRSPDAPMPIYNTTDNCEAVFSYTTASS